MDNVTVTKGLDLIIFVLILVVYRPAGLLMMLKLGQKLPSRVQFH